MAKEEPIESDPLEPKAPKFGEALGLDDEQPGGQACVPEKPEESEAPGEPEQPGQEPLSPEAEEQVSIVVDETMMEIVRDATEEVSSKPGAKKRLGAWIGKKTRKVVSQLYESRVDDIEHRARRAVSSAYEDQADDLEERAVRAMRTALTEESDRIKDVIEHAIQIKKREVRLSLLVLVVASVLYLLLYWATR